MDLRPRYRWRIEHSEEWQRFLFIYRQLRGVQMTIGHDSLLTDYIDLKTLPARFNSVNTHYSFDIHYLTF